MNKDKLLNGLTDIRKDLAERRGYDYSGVKYLEYVITHIDTDVWKCDECNECDEKKPMNRADILESAKKCVCGQREQDYGTPESNFQLIANLWNDYLSLPYDHSDWNETRVTIPKISSTDVAMMMALMKIARIKNGGGTGDSFVDLAGYAACGGEINSSRGLRAKAGVIDDHVESLKRKSERYPWGEAKTTCANCKWQDEDAYGEHCHFCGPDESHWEEKKDGDQE